MENTNTTDIRKKVKIKMIELGLDFHGSQKRLADRIGVNYNILSMALTGYRTGPRYEQILHEIHKALDKIQAL